MKLRQNGTGDCWVSHCTIELTTCRLGRGTKPNINQSRLNPTYNMQSGRSAINRKVSRFDQSGCPLARGTRLYETTSEWILFYVFLGGQDLQDFGDFLSPAARGPSAKGRFIPIILLILSNCFFLNKNPFHFGSYFNCRFLTFLYLIRLAVVSPAAAARMKLHRNGFDFIFF